ncbi:hypothetical protein OHU34_19355 [Streptomyces sp. NBC_00080]|uniref:hypothetical protein n=1 Tax=Streptomyces sp. NBC_00080 TaxID=2975645 RepID=UPI0032440213
MDTENGNRETKGSSSTESSDSRRGRASWQQFALARIHELEAREEAARCQENISAKTERLLDGVSRNLDYAKDGAERSRSIRTGPALERTWNHIYAAQILLLEVVENGDLPAWGWEILAMARQHLGSTDPRRMRLEEILIQPEEMKPLAPEDREIAVQTLRAAQDASSVEKMQARSFRAILVATTIILMAVAAGLAVFGYFLPNVMQMCFHTDTIGTKLICAASETRKPGPYDTLAVEVIGLAAAALTAAFTIRKLDGTSTPYSIPFSLALLKLPAGAISAVIGLELIASGILPGVIRPITREDIFAWAVIFGASQQILTRYIDAKGREVLDNVRGSESKQAGSETT